MTKDEIQVIPAGPEMDMLVAQNVMGWTIGPEEEIWDQHMHFKQKVQCWLSPAILEYWIVGKFNPSSDISAAWEVVEKMQSMGYCFDADGNARVKRIRFGIGQEIGEAETMPLAICRAALLVVSIQSSLSQQ